MATDFLELVNMVLEEIDEDRIDAFSDNPSSEERRVKKYVNLAYREIFDEKPDWSWARINSTFSTVANQAAYDNTDLNSATVFEKIEALWLNGSGTLEALPWEEFKRKYGEYENEASGKPYIYYVLADNVFLWPTPDDAYTVNYVTQVGFTALTDETDEPLIKEGKRDVIYHLALFYAKNFENDADQEKQYQVYQKRLRALMNAEGNYHKGHRITPEEETIMPEYYDTIMVFD